MHKYEGEDGKNMTTVGFRGCRERGPRSGCFRLSEGDLETPTLFPVASLITGTTPRGGGIWKYVLQAHPHGLLRQQRPIMTQVLHFLDFSIRPKWLAFWRQRPLREHYQAAFPELHYRAPLFCDSGGFRLLWNSQLDLSRYGLEATPQTILHLQQDFGASLLATLDYPLPSGLVRAEAEARMARSLANVGITLRLLAEQSGPPPFVYAAVHGQTPDDLRHAVQRVFALREAEGLQRIPLGIAIGSLVPLRLRGAEKLLTIIDLVQAAIEGIPAAERPTTPVHLFGVTGTLIPLLAYLGVDTFDSSTYVQMARSLRYHDPVRHHFVPVLELQEWTCSCPVCQTSSLAELQAGLTSLTPAGRPLENGSYKSRYYAEVALHNLEQDLRLVEEVRQAVAADALADFLLRWVEGHERLREALARLQQRDERLRRLGSRRSFGGTSQPSLPAGTGGRRAVSLAYTPEAFNIVSNGYAPPVDKRLLLVLPCSGEKPYSQSRTHRYVRERLQAALGEQLHGIHWVTLSGLYGPVPEEWEQAPEVLGYDFRLEGSNQQQIELVAGRLTRYLERWGEHYVACLGYATSRAYRQAMELAARRTGRLEVLPCKPKARRLTAFFRREYLEELVASILIQLEQADG
ncbi:tRNA-guanine transglycosylase [Thermogemmatispora onikobensis]|uniref:tRNA-guanine transglycosylase n=1 Tax=Thermogemmatispora onikobensis TaxID=732234 RepID=UPI00114CCBEA|nr:tRNA-guanine transglycosylase [Thermogemmatispora onikobensis]